MSDLESVAELRAQLKAVLAPPVVEMLEALIAETVRSELAGGLMRATAHRGSRLLREPSTSACPSGSSSD